MLGKPYTTELYPQALGLLLREPTIKHLWVLTPPNHLIEANPSTMS
jgi:hypothetical protein